MTVVYSLTLKPRPPYSLGILIPKAPSLLRPSSTSSGYSPVSSMATGSTFSRRTVGVGAVSVEELLEVGAGHNADQADLGVDHRIEQLLALRAAGPQRVVE